MQIKFDASELNSPEKEKAEVAKKVWHKPEFEVISKDIVKSGTIHGTEGHSASSFQS